MPLLRLHATPRISSAAASCLATPVPSVSTAGVLAKGAIGNDSLVLIGKIIDSPAEADRIVKKPGVGPGAALPLNPVRNTPILRVLG